MQQRRITLEDGRYLIFYTFEDEAAPSASSEASGETERARKVESQAKPQAEEEESV
jgi:hypothetical protein